MSLRLGIRIFTLAAVALFLVVPAAGTAAMRIVHGPKMPPAPKEVPRNTLMIGGPSIRSKVNPPVASTPPTPDKGPAFLYSRSALRTRQAKRSVTASPMAYHNGYAMLYDYNYLIFWEPNRLQGGQATSVPTNYNSLLAQYFVDVGGSGIYNNNTQYWGTPGDGYLYYITNYSKYAGYVIDRSAYPPSGCYSQLTGYNCMADSQLQAEIRKVLGATGWTPSLYSQFWLFTSYGEGNCAGSACFQPGGYCAYHSVGGYGNGSYIYGNMPYAGTAPNSCFARYNGVALAPNGNAAIDSEISIASHEQMEAVTDPYLNGWFGPGGIADEIGDKCAYRYGNRPYRSGNGNTYMNGHYYILQEEWDNRAGGCVRYGP